MAIALCALPGCTTTRSPVGAFYENDYGFAAKRFKELRAKRDKNFALYSCNLGEAQLAAGNLLGAKEALLDATAVMNNLASGELRGLGSLIGPESIKVFRGDPFEKAMVDAHNGIVHYVLGDYENAAVGFRRTLLADKNSKEGYRDDFGLAHYMLGKALLKQGDVETAQVAFRNAKKLAPKNPYLDLAANRDANLTLVIDLGKAPVKAQSGPSGSIDVYRRSGYREAYATVSADGKQLGRSAQILDLYHQAKHSERSAKDAIQAAKGATKLGAAGVAAISRDDRVRLVALLIAMLMPAEADIRQCELLPGEVHILHAKLPPGLHTIDLHFHRQSGVRLPRYDQRWYHIPVEQGRETLLYCRAIPNRGMTQVVTTQMEKKSQP